MRENGDERNGQSKRMSDARRSDPSVRSGHPRKDNYGSKISIKLKLILAFSLITLIFIVSAVINISIGIREIDVKGVELCTREEILSVAGIEEGSGYFSYNTSSAEKKIKELYPCVVDIRISRSTFGKVTVSVTEEKALWYVESYSEYFALSEDLRVIKSEENKKRFIECGLVRLDFPEIKSAVLGKTIEIRDDDRDPSYVFDLLSDIRATDLYNAGRVDQIKIKNKFDVYVVVDRRHLVSIGNCTEIAYKLGQVRDVLSDSRFDWTKKSEILVFDPKSPTVRENSELDFSYLNPTK